MPHPHRTPALRPFSSARALVVVTLAATHALALGCATLGAPPLDEDLVTDGSPEAKGELLRAYRVVYEDGSFRRPGDGDPGNTPSSQAFTDESYNYLSSSAPARDVLDGALTVRLDRATRTGVLPAILSLGVPVMIVGGAAGFAYLGLVANATDPRNVLVDNQVATTTAWAAGGAVVGCAGGLLLLALTSSVLATTSPFIASGAYRDAANAFNDDLAARIDRAVDPNAKTRVRRVRRHHITVEERTETPGDDDDDDDDGEGSDATPSLPTTPLPSPGDAPPTPTAPDAPKDKAPETGSGPIDPA